MGNPVFDRHGREGVMILDERQWQFKVRNQSHEVVIRQTRASNGDSWEPVVCPPTNVFEALEAEYPKFEVCASGTDDW